MENINSSIIHQRVFGLLASSVMGITFTIGGMSLK